MEDSSTATGGQAGSHADPRGIQGGLKAHASVARRLCGRSSGHLGSGASLRRYALHISALYFPRPALLVIALPLVLASCGAGERAVTVVRHDSVGVEIVRTFGTVPVMDLGADTVSLIGGEDSGPASFYQVRSPLVDVDQKGLIYVLDPDRRQVVALTAAGELVETWGREGGGPGELRFPLSVTVSRGVVTVHDAGRVLFVSYSPDGVLDERSAPYSIISDRLRHVEAISDHLVYWQRDRFIDSDGRVVANVDDRVVRLIAANGTDTISLIDSQPTHTSTAYHPRCSARFTIAIPLAPSIHWSQWGDRFVIVAWPDFRVDWFEGAQLVRRASFGEQAPELTRREAAALLEARGTRGPCNTSPIEFIEKHGYMPRPQAIRAVALHPDGSLWVHHEETTGRQRIIVFDSTAVPVGVLPEGFPMPLTFLPDGRALIQVVDSVDIERIGVVAMIPRSIQMSPPR